MNDRSRKHGHPITCTNKPYTSLRYFIECVTMINHNDNVNFLIEHDLRVITKEAMARYLIHAIRGCAMYQTMNIAIMSDTIEELNGHFTPQEQHHMLCTLAYMLGEEEFRFAEPSEEQYRLFGKRSIGDSFDAKKRLKKIIDATVKMLSIWEKYKLYPVAADVINATEKICCIFRFLLIGNISELKAEAYQKIIEMEPRVADFFVLNELNQYKCKVEIFPRAPFQVFGERLAVMICLLDDTILNKTIEQCHRR